MSFVIFFIINSFLAIMEIVIPYLVKRSIVFGVSIPERFTKNRKLAAYKKAILL
ncbi:hypothetical protein V7152_24130 [Neobacillus drentensis]